jgi:hypothetical protein
MNLTLVLQLNWQLLHHQYDYLNDVRKNKVTCVLLQRLSSVRDEFDLSASDNLSTPSALKSLPLLSEHEMKQILLPNRSSAVRDEFDLSASDNLIVPSEPIPLTVMSENEMNKEHYTGD